MSKGKLKSYWEWTFKDKWYYIVLGIYFFVNDSSRYLFTGRISLTEAIANIIGLGIIMAVLFFFVYLIYRAGYKKASK
jgi:hypothetical protein